jgi:hypothetical protein
VRRTPLRPFRQPPRRRPLRPGPGPRRRTPLRRHAPSGGPGHLSAAPAQRAKVAGRRCLVCGSVARVDPAHLIPRSLGGCDEPDCVVPLCRTHHRVYDAGALDLLPFLEPRWRAELAHAVQHVGLLGAIRRVTGRRDKSAA